MASTTRADRERTASRMVRTFTIVAALIGTFAVAGIIASVATPGAEQATFDSTLPNPMGGPARAAPGEASGEVTFAGLAVADAEIAMGDVALGVTYVPGWEVTNPTDREVTFAAGQPQILEGCCPGPVYADGELTQVGQELTVPPGGSVLLQFPLQMHRGMDGPHHLAIPLVADGEEAAVHVSGNFDPSAPAV
jgi:hypothetical protein